MSSITREGGLRTQLIGLGGVIERNSYLVKRYRLVGAGVLRLDGGQHAVDRADRQRRPGYRRPSQRQPGDDLAADRGRDLVLPRDHLRDPDRDRRVGALGGHDRVHVHGAAVAAPFTWAAWPCSPCSTAILRTALLFLVVAVFFGLHFHDANFATALVLLAIASVSFAGVGMVTAVLPLISPEKGAQFGLHRPGPPARRLRRLLPGVGTAAVDAVDREDLAGHLCAARDPRRDPRRRRPLNPVGQYMAAAGARRRAIPLGLFVFSARRALRQAAREAQAVRVIGLAGFRRAPLTTSGAPGGAPSASNAVRSATR